MTKPPTPGYLLTELGWLDEMEAAASLDLAPQTLVGYRRNGIGPAYTELARKIVYSKEALAAWLKAGGTRAADESLKGKPSYYGRDAEAPEPARAVKPPKHPLLGHNNPPPEATAGQTRGIKKRTER